MIKHMARLRLSLALALLVAAALARSPVQAAPTAAIYYVSSTDGSDTNDGLSSGAPFKSIQKVNGLALLPGDQVLFKCGDSWRGEMLRVIRSGSSGSPIRYGSYPGSDCANQPLLSGAQPVGGWSLHTGSIYVADLAAGANAARFQSSPDPALTPAGVNQVFRGSQRLGIGRWPNIDAPDGGYSTIDGQPSGTQLIDAALPDISWTGATAHIKGMRWYLLNRTISADSGDTLTVNSALDCWGGCTGWGFWIDSHLSTLDQDGEWYYDHPARRLYLYSSGGSPADGQVEASVVYTSANDSAYLGGVQLGRHLNQHIAYVEIENLHIARWFMHGITTPVNLKDDENREVTLRNNRISDVDGAGINLQTWVWEPDAGYAGWRGGRNLQLLGNRVETANRFGINSYARQTLMQDNLVRDIGQIKNLGKAGMGCGTSDNGGLCTEDGAGIRTKVDQDGSYSGNNVTLRFNRVETSGYHGIQLAGGHTNTVDRNVIVRACGSKGDCGGISSFGSAPLASSTVHDVSITQNIIVDTLGNTDGARSDFDPLFGFGIYLDNYSRNMTVTSNSVISSTVAGILYQNSTGAIQNNTLFNNSAGSMWAYQVNITGASSISAFTGNTMLAKLSTAGTLRADSSGQLVSSNNNSFNHASRTAHIHVQGDRTLLNWRAYAPGKDTLSTERVEGVLAQSEIFYNDTKLVKVITLGRPYEDLAGAAAGPTLTLQPFTSKILVPSGPAFPLLSLSKAAPSWISSGQSFTYTLTIANLGGSVANNLVLTDTLPDGVDYLSGGTLVGAEVRWNIASLGPGASVSRSFQVQHNPGSGKSEAIVNESYGVIADGGYSDTGPPVQTLVDPERVLLPLVEG